MRSAQSGAVGGSLRGKNRIFLQIHVYFFFQIGNFLITLDCLFPELLWLASRLMAVLQSCFYFFLFLLSSSKSALLIQFSFLTFSKQLFLCFSKFLFSFIFLLFSIEFAYSSCLSYLLYSSSSFSKIILSHNFSCSPSPDTTLTAVYNQPHREHSE